MCNEQDILELKKKYVNAPRWTNYVMCPTYLKYSISISAMQSYKLHTKWYICKKLKTAPAIHRSTSVSEHNNGKLRQTASSTYFYF